MRLKYRILLLLAGDILLAVAALYTAFILRFGVHEPCDIFICNNPFVIVFLIAIEIFSSYMTECYRLESNVKKRALILNLILGGCLSFFILSAFYYLSPDLMIGRGLLFLNVSIFVFYQLLWHFIFFFSHNHPRFSQKVIVVGVGRVAHEIGSVVKSTTAGYSFAGYVQCNNEAVWGKIDPDEILSSSDTLRDAAIQQNADLLIVALTERRGFSL